MSPRTTPPAAGMTGAATTAVRRGPRTTPRAAWMTAANLVLARELWDEGLGTKAIGRRVGTTKHAIVGHAHRHGWPPRPSPLGRRKGEVREAVPRVPDKPHHRGAPTPRKRPERAPEELRVTCRPQALAEATAAFRGCQFPLNERRPWRFCDAPAVPGIAWCPAHKSVCYMRSPRQELVAA